MWSFKKIGGDTTKRINLTFSDKIREKNSAKFFFSDNSEKISSCKINFFWKMKSVKIRSLKAVEIDNMLCNIIEENIETNTIYNSNTLLMTIIDSS